MDQPWLIKHTVGRDRLSVGRVRKEMIDLSFTCYKLKLVDEIVLADFDSVSKDVRSTWHIISP